jgi:hypothetical protein
VRAQFINNGKLANTEDTNYRAVSNDWPVFAFAKNLGTVTSTATSPVVFTIGHVRDPAIQYITAHDVMQPRSVYFWTSFSTVAEAVCKYVCFTLNKMVYLVIFQDLFLPQRLRECSVARRDTRC